MSYYCYILKSLSHGTFYYGSTADAGKRLKEHNSGKVRYTKGRRPWELHYLETFETRSDAMKREYYFKTMDGRRFLKANNYNLIFIKLRTRLLSLSLGGVEDGCTQRTHQG